MSDTSVREEVAIANRILAEAGIASGVLASLGHASMRVPDSPDHFIVKGRGYPVDALALMKGDDMVVCDLAGFKVEGPPGVTQCFEVQMHSCIYRRHPSVQSVVHAHPRFVVLMSVLQATLLPMCQEGIRLVGRALPVYHHCKTVRSEAEGTEVASLLGDAKAILLEGHGATTVGSSLTEAVMNMLQLEEQARMNWYAYCAQGPQHRCISDELVEELSNRTPLSQLPHFTDAMADAQPRTSGAWDYYAKLVSMAPKARGGSCGN